MEKDTPTSVTDPEEDLGFLRDLVRASPQVVYVYDQLRDRLEYATANLQDTLGYSLTEVQDMRGFIWAIAHPDDVPLLKTHVRRMLKAEEGVSVSSTFRARHSKGHYIWLNTVDRFIERDPQGLVCRTVGHAMDVTTSVEAKAALERTNRVNVFLLGSSRILSDMESDHHTTMQRLAEYVSVHFGAVCQVSTVHPPETHVEPLAMYHPDSKVRGAIRKVLSTKKVNVGEGVIGKVVAEGCEVLVAEVPLQERERIAGQEPLLVPYSYIHCPLHAKRGVIGAISIIRLMGRPSLTEDELGHVRKLAEHIAMFLDNAWLYDNQRMELELRRKTQIELHHANKVNRFLLSVSRILSDLQADVDETLRLLAESVAQHFNVYCVIYLPDTDGSLRPKAHYHHDADVLKALTDVLSDPKKENGLRVARHVMRSGKAFIVNSADERPEENDMDPRLVTRSYGFWPLSGRETLGAISICRLLDQPRFTDDEMDRATQLATHISLSLENMALHERQRQSEEHLRVLVDNVDDVIMAVDWDGTILSINNPRQGFTEEQVIGHSIYEHMDEELLENTRKSMTVAKETGEPFEVLMRLHGPDGTAEWYLTHYCPFKSGEMLVSVSRNITHLKESELQVMNGMTLGQEQERKRLGAELHDGVGQILSSIALELSQLRQTEALSAHFAEQLAELSERVSATITEVRNISHDLMPGVLESFGLAEALREVCHNMQERTGIHFRFDPIDLNPQYAEAIETHVYRITQELIANTVRHAHCSKVHINLIDHGQMLSLSVEDDGIGFDPDSVSNGIGLRNVASRVSILRGTLSVESSQTSGTLVHIELPTA